MFLVCVGECDGHILPYAPTLTTAQALTIVSFQQPGKLTVGDDLRPLGLHPTTQSDEFAQLPPLLPLTTVSLPTSATTTAPLPSCLGS